MQVVALLAVVAAVSARPQYFTLAPGGGFSGISGAQIVQVAPQQIAFAPAPAPVQTVLIAQPTKGECIVTVWLISDKIWSSICVKHITAPEPVDPNPQYSYSYNVNDAETGDSKSATETRDGDKVSGSYSVVEPDGAVRTVTYTADAENGFNAKVERTPAAAPAVVVAAAPAPVQRRVVYVQQPAAQTIQLVQQPQAIQYIQQQPQLVQLVRGASSAGQGLVLVR